MVCDCQVLDFATIVPGNRSTYIFDADHEEEYRRNYRNARYSLTWRKGGYVVPAEGLESKLLNGHAPSNFQACPVVI